MASKVREGMVVRSADGARLGRVALLGERDFQIEKGSFFPREYVASYAVIAEIRDDEVILSLDKASFKRGDVPTTEEVALGTRSPDADQERHEQQLESLKHAQHERAARTHGEEEASFDRRISGAGATTIAVVRETILIEHEHGVSADGDDAFRDEGVGIEEEGEVRAFRGPDVSVSKTHRQVEVRYSASDESPDGVRREERLREDDWEE